MTIQIMKIYKESLLDIRTHKWEWLRVTCGPILVFVLGMLLVALFYGSNGNPFEINIELDEIIFTEDFSFFFIFSHIIFAITSFIALFSVQINGYRYAVLREGGDRWITLNLNMRFVKLVLFKILFGLLSSLYWWISVGIILVSHMLVENIGVDIILGILLGLGALYLVYRLVLYPVVISVDQIKPLRTSWRLLKGNVLRLIGLLILVFLTIALIGLAGSIVLGLFSMLLGFVSPILGVLSLILWLIFGFFMWLIGWALNSKVLGLVYQELSVQ